MEKEWSFHCHKMLNVLAVFVDVTANPFEAAFCPIDAETVRDHDLMDKLHEFPKFTAGRGDCTLVAAFVNHCKDVCADQNEKEENNFKTENPDSIWRPPPDWKKKVEPMLGKIGRFGCHCWPLHPNLTRLEAHTQGRELLIAECRSVSDPKRIIDRILHDKKLESLTADVLALKTEKRSRGHVPSGSCNTPMQKLLPQHFDTIECKWKKADCALDLALLLKKCSVEQGNDIPFKIFNTLEICQTDSHKVALQAAKAKAASEAKKLAEKTTKDAAKQKLEAEKIKPSSRTDEDLPNLTCEQQDWAKTTMPCSDATPSVHCTKIIDGAHVMHPLPSQTFIQAFKHRHCKVGVLMDAPDEAHGAEMATLMEIAEIECKKSTQWLCFASLWMGLALMMDTVGATTFTADADGKPAMDSIIASADLANEANASLNFEFFLQSVFPKGKHNLFPLCATAFCILVTDKTRSHSGTSHNAVMEILETQLAQEDSGVALDTANTIRQVIACA